MEVVVFVVISKPRSMPNVPLSGTWEWDYPLSVETFTFYLNSPCGCCPDIVTFAANHCPKCGSGKTIRMSEVTPDKELIFICCDCCSMFDMRAEVLKYLPAKSV